MQGANIHVHGSMHVYNIQLHQPAVHIHGHTADDNDSISSDSGTTLDGRNDDYTDRNEDQMGPGTGGGGGGGGPSGHSGQSGPEQGHASTMSPDVSSLSDSSDMSASTKRRYQALLDSLKDTPDHDNDEHDDGEEYDSDVEIELDGAAEEEAVATDVEEEETDHSSTPLSSEAPWPWPEQDLPDTPVKSEDGDWGSDVGCGPPSSSSSHWLGATDQAKGKGKGK